MLKMCSHDKHIRARERENQKNYILLTAIIINKNGLCFLLRFVYCLFQKHQYMRRVDKKTHRGKKTPAYTKRSAVVDDDDDDDEPKQK